MKDEDMLIMLEKTCRESVSCSVVLLRKTGSGRFPVNGASMVNNPMHAGTSQRLAERAGRFEGFLLTACSSCRKQS